MEKICFWKNSPTVRPSNISACIIKFPPRWLPCLILCIHLQTVVNKHLTQWKCNCNRNIYTVSMSKSLHTINVSRHAVDCKNISRKMIPAESLMSWMEYTNYQWIQKILSPTDMENLWVTVLWVTSKVKHAQKIYEITN